MYNNKRIVAIVQARMTSSRLPGKVLLPLANKPVLQHIIERLRRSKYLDDVAIACTTNEADNPIIELCDSLNCTYYRGSEDDVLTRVLEAARENKAEIVVDVTGDCPTICWSLADECVEKLFLYYEADYASNVVRRTYPRGLDVQAFTIQALERVNNEADNFVDREHVTSWMYKNPKGRFKIEQVFSKYDNSRYRITLDTREDYFVLDMLFKAFNDNGFDVPDIINFIKTHEELFDLNKHIEQKNYYKELAEAYAKQNMI